MLATLYLALGAGFTIGFVYQITKTVPITTHSDESEVSEVFNEESPDNNTIILTSNNSNMPFNGQPRSVRLISNVRACRNFVKEIEADIVELQVLGFDCEWVPGIFRTERTRRRVSTLQLCTHRGLCGVIQLTSLKIIPEELKKILRDETILKVGDDALEDARKLRSDYGIRVYGTLDLRHIAQPTLTTANLENIAARYLGIHKRMEGSIHQHWNYVHLPQRNIQYAAQEAYIGIELYKFFQQERLPHQIARMSSAITRNPYDTPSSQSEFQSWPSRENP